MQGTGPLAGLNNAQRRAVEHDAGPLIVLAGPGTGKTRVITHRVARLINDGVEPETILALTYTTRAAGELRDRLGSMVGAAADRVQARTFHALGQRLIGRFADLLDLPAQTRLIDSAVTRRVLRSLIRRHDLFPELRAQGRDTILDEVVGTMSLLANAGLFPEDARDRARRWRERLEQGLFDDDLTDADAGPAERLQAEMQHQRRFAQIAELYSHFRHACRARGHLTFDDLILEPIRLLRDHAAAAAMVRAEVRHIVVDEFQDTNAAQIELLRLLAPPRPAPDLCVVGDDDQSIYEFRGADDRAFARFAALWTGHEQIALEENYRSRRVIIDAAAVTIGNASRRFAPDKTIRPPAGAIEHDAGVAEGVLLTHHSRAGEVIAAMILADRHRHGTARAWRDYAVIARSNNELDPIADALEMEGIPAHRARPPSPLDEPAVRALLLWTQVLVQEQRAAAQQLLRLPPLSLPVARVVKWHQAFEAFVSRQGEPDDTASGFFAFLLEHTSHDPEHAEDVRRIVALFRLLREEALHRPADEALLTIVTRAGLVHADLPTAEDRASRIAGLSAVLRFARDRLDLLDEPRDLGAFWSYYNDLDPHDQHFGGLGPAQVEGGPDEEHPDAVTLITAHSSKGLEFDTVFVPRVRSPHGYPTRRGDDRLRLPCWMAADPRDDEPRAEEARDAEERRLFYVAITRARRRLVLLPEQRKARTKSLDFYDELALDAGARLGFIQRSESEVLGEAAGLGVRLCTARDVEAADKATLAHRRARLLDAARREARAMAAGALDAADKPELSAGARRELEARLGESAARMAIVAALSSGRPVPAWAEAPDTPASVRAFAERLRSGLTSQIGPARLFTPIPPPITLSFTDIEEYLRCPRCWYMRKQLGWPRIEHSPQVVGTAVHEALQFFYSRIRTAAGCGQPEPTLDWLIAEAERQFHARWPAAAPLDREQLQRVRSLAKAYYDAFHCQGVEIEGIEMTIRRPYPCGGATHTIVAKIDRLDRMPGGAPGHRIVDYKTGRASKKYREPDKADLQMGVYALALAHFQGAGPDEPAVGVGEYHLVAEGITGRIDLASIDLKKIRSKIDETIKGMLAGMFDRAPKCTAGCDVLGD